MEIFQDLAKWLWKLTAFVKNSVVNNVNKTLALKKL